MVIKQYIFTGFVCFGNDIDESKKKKNSSNCCQDTLSMIRIPHPFESKRFHLNGIECKDLVTLLSHVWVYQNDQWRGLSMNESKIRGITFNKVYTFPCFLCYPHRHQSYQLSYIISWTICLHQLSLCHRFGHFVVGYTFVVIIHPCFLLIRRSRWRTTKRSCLPNLD